MGVDWPWCSPFIEMVRTICFCSWFPHSEANCQALGGLSSEFSPSSILILSTQLLNTEVPLEKLPEAFSDRHVLSPQLLACLPDPKSLMSVLRILPKGAHTWNTVTFPQPASRGPSAHQHRETFALTLWPLSAQDCLGRYSISLRLLRNAYYVVAIAD